MQFKEGDRVHVTLINYKYVNFYATLKEMKSTSYKFKLTNCTDNEREDEIVWGPNEHYFGSADYYTTLATDEEDTEEPEVQRINDQFNFARSKKYDIQEYIQEGKNLNNAKNMKEGTNMPTIKTKKEMNLPELIEWGWNNTKAVENKIFESDNIGCYGHYSKIYFSNDGQGLYTDGVTDKDTFTVEIEEEITEDTVFDKLISRYVFLSSKPCYAHSINKSIKEVIEDRKVATHIYLENEDNELQLIWTKEKGLVE